MSNYPELVASRRQWIETVLQPWCRTASRRDLLLAEQEWQNLAGRPAPEMTLWVWAWSRFPILCGPGLTSLNETSPVIVTCRNGQSTVGYPDARKTEAGQLILVSEEGAQLGPFSIDDILNVESIKES